MRNLNEQKEDAVEGEVEESHEENLTEKQDF